MLASKRSRSARDATAQASAAEAFGVVTGSATREHRGIVGGGVDRERIIEHRCRLRRGLRGLGHADRVVVAAPIVRTHHGIAQPGVVEQDFGEEIGRASWRARVCKYV